MNVTTLWGNSKKLLRHRFWDYCRPVEVIAAMLTLFIVVDVRSRLGEDRTTIDRQGDVSNFVGEMNLVDVGGDVGEDDRNAVLYLVVLDSKREYVHDEVSYTANRSRWYEKDVQIGAPCTISGDRERPYEVALYRANSAADFRSIESRLQDKEKALRNDPDGRTWMGDEQGTSPIEDLVGSVSFTRRDIPACPSS